ncbi:MAG: hypothetical protein ACRENI_04535 [Gemmatimonadaceae bacterium]
MNYTSAVCIRLVVIASTVAIMGCAADGPSSPIFSTPAAAGTELTIAADNAADRGARPRRARRAHLLVCPTNRSFIAQARIGPEGGSLAVQGNRIDVPPGALREWETLTMSVPSGRLVRVDINAAGANHYLFERPVSITISYNRCRRQNLHVWPTGVWHIDTAPVQLLDYLGGTSDREMRRITFQANHLSTYAVAY